MEERVVVQGKVFIVPSNRVSSLIAWLQSNAVDGSNAAPMQESIQTGKELLMESK